MMLMKSKRRKNNTVELDINTMNIEDELSKDELEQLEKDAHLDGKPGTIPNWSKHYKAKDTDKK